MKQKLAKTSLLAHPAPGTQFSLVIDASGTAVGAVLQQQHQQQLQPLAYFSKQLKPAEQHNSTFGCVSSYVLRSATFSAFTQGLPICNLLRSKLDKYSPYETRHLDFISQFTNDIRHITGEQNVAANALSRLPINSLSSPSDIILQRIVFDQPHLDMLDLSSPEFASSKFIYLPVLTSDTQMICNISTDSPCHLVPTIHRRAVFNILHNLAHPGIAATVKLILARFFWLNMRRDITACTCSCVSCKKSKVHLSIHLALQTLGSVTFTLISLDHGWSVEDSNIS